ncbi:Heavy metal transport/detoxification superfamily protein isoform 3 [Theobroma cacao]|uniref:Heavy metal transport/detoxification superfamily protein isoform 3 n=1 Tax=Theobroma cacao TaxID=3641 RepID=A0A061GHD5_THECC|nr:Heavy metal transport/detoxification superfamily protein isoform 3 [Theobroma cacao]
MTANFWSDLVESPLLLTLQFCEENREENKGKEKKEEAKDEKKEDEKKEEKKEEEPPEIVLKVDMHCEACARKVARALKGFEGVEEVSTDSKASKVVVKGKTADPIKVCERLQKKSGRKVELISPLPKPPEEKKEENKEPKEEKKEEPPAAITVVMKVRMHCEACAQVLQKRIRKIQGVESVETDVGNDQVIVKGVVDPTKLVDDVYKKTKKQASIVKDEEKKEEEKKEEKKEEKEGEKKEGEEGKGEEDTKSDIKRSEYYPSKFYSEYAYHPEIFSDENPNACSVM